MTTGLKLISGGSSVTTLVKINNEPYLARHYKSITGLNDKRPTLLTIFRPGRHQRVDREYLERTVKHYEDSDDVFNRHCLEGVLIQGSDQQNLSLTDDARRLLDEWNTIWQGPHSCERKEDQIPPGPYYLDEKGLHQLYKIQDDSNKAFIVATLPSLSEKCKWEDAQVSGQTHQTLGVPVPSRLYSEKTSELPLNGVRIAVKDIYHMAGLRTSVCNRAYLSLYGPRTETAECIKKLVNRGAQIVGKTHLSSFAWKEEPTECIDFQAPFNPRGDGYQSPAGSSSGSGAAIASYDWIDFTLGTDTTGSGRRPALWNGSFALRPSANLLSTKGMVPTSPKFDVPSFFGRDIRKFSQLMRAWYERDLSTATDVKKQWAVVQPKDYLASITNSDQLMYIKNFSNSLAEYLSVDVQELSLADEWEKTCDEKEPFNEYLSSVQEHGFFYDLYNCFNDFRTQYEDEHKHPPYVSPPTQWLWSIARLMDEKQWNEAMRRFDVFKEWFLREIMVTQRKNTLVILPIENLEPRYRDVPMNPPTRTPKGLSVLFLSPTLGAPELVVPVGHSSYISDVTGKQEHLPVAVAILAAPDSDMQLVELIEGFLTATGRPTEVETGRTMWNPMAHKL